MSVSTMSTLRHVGGATVAGGILFIVLSMLTRERLDALGARGYYLSREVATGVGIIIIGIGLYFGRKWAAIVFALGTGSLGIGMCIGSVLAVPVPFAVLNIAIGCCLWFQPSGCGEIGPR